MATAKHPCCTKLKNRIEELGLTVDDPPLNAAELQSTSLGNSELRESDENEAMQGLDPRVNSTNGRQQIELVNELNVPGLIIYKCLTFETHVADIRRRAADIYKQLACTAKVTWGLNPEIIRTIYFAVIKLIVLYAASSWSPAVDLLINRNQLNMLKRRFEQKICKSYHQISLNAVLALSGLPCWTWKRESAALYKHKGSS
ncbi:Putative 115 kDa protein in type-1 retrotransposable element R1DM [Eumeta japonica]|uniref:115 kDa protein in type-1 retrotransposable element R1DM n=1 Tax=Eumeta variegata TaxID=151549 RepID=A0A4C1ZH82_EUMVA|nr:Putative 115 kDa protein in type-1 retrotransposable element R1DM [Eumeta japonica]